MSTENQKLVERIRALRAKAESPDIGEAEAALFAEKVAGLLQKHNLSEAMLEVKDNEEAIVEDRMYNSKTGDPWAQQLASAVAELYFCDIYLVRQRHKKKVVFVGRPHNIEIAKSMTEYLIKTIGRLANAYARSPTAIEQWDYTFTSARNGFERGAGNRLYWRIHKMREEQAKKEAPTRAPSGNATNLPALYADEAKLVENYIESIKLNPPRGRGSDISGDHAAHGAAAADTISLSSQIKGNTKMLEKK